MLKCIDFSPPCNIPGSICTSSYRKLLFTAVTFCITSDMSSSLNYAIFFDCAKVSDAFRFRPWSNRRTFYRMKWYLRFKNFMIYVTDLSQNFFLNNCFKVVIEFLTFCCSTLMLWVGIYFSWEFWHCRNTLIFLFIFF